MDQRPGTQQGNGGVEPKRKPVSNDNVRREIDRLARQTEGISKALKRLKESV